MGLQSISMTETDYTAVFVVTNAGVKLVSVTSCGCSWYPTNILRPLGEFGRCTVPAGTACTMIVTWGTPDPKPVSFRYAVFEKASVPMKARVAAGRLSSDVMGKGRYTSFWIPDLWSPAYEIVSPTVTIPPGPSLRTPWDTDPRLRTPRGALRAFREAQPGSAANRSQPGRVETNRASAAAGSGR